jgi:hypothetical protein
MNRTHLARWLVGAAIAGGALALRAYPANAAPTNPRLAVVQRSSNPNCRPSSTEFYFAEAWAYGFAHTKSCEAISMGGTSLATCAAASDRHVALVTRRTSNLFAYVATVAGPSAEQTTWGATSATATFNTPSTTDCPGGATIDAYSFGYDLANAP